MGGRFCEPGCTCKRHVPRTAESKALMSKNRRGKGTQHGMTKHPLFSTWYHMMSRCYNTNETGYKYWGGSGVKTCEEWRDIRLFIQWMESCEGIGWRPDGDISLDRIDNTGDYEPGNVRWADRLTQNQNRRPYGSVV
jgi:hypothetical protein